MVLGNTTLTNGVGPSYNYPDWYLETPLLQMVNDPVSLNLKIAKIFLFREHYKIVTTRMQTIEKNLSHTQLKNSQKKKIKKLSPSLRWLLHIPPLKIRCSFTHT